MTERQVQAVQSVELLRRVAVRDEEAATELFERYAERLIALARSRLATKLAARVDPEDIVLSAYRSFFAAASAGRFEVQHGGDLWRLLVEMTLHKLYRTSKYHLAQQRSVGREQYASGAYDLGDFLVGREPTPDEALSAADELQAVFGELNDRDRQAVELRLQGYEHEEIAERLNCNERTVRRAVNQARRVMAARGGNDFVPSAARRPASPSTLVARDDHPTISDRDAPLMWDNYLLHEQIGAGATGRIYRATRKSDGQEYAIKFLRKSLTSRAAAVHRFLGEAKTVSSFACPGIVPVYGVGKTPSRGLFLLMELLCGPDLEQIGRQNAFTTVDAVHWIARAAEALHVAHAKGVIHCDLKPSNILLDRNGRACITDFGFARRVEVNDCNAPRLAGTPAFMAPEQVDTWWGAISPRTDIWGLGGVLFFLLYGRPPHEGLDMASTLSQVVSKQPVFFPEATKRSIPHAVREIICRCLCKEPNERIESAQKLAAMLQNVAAVTQ